MKSSAFYAVIGAGVLIVAGIIWWGISHGHVSSTPQSPVPHTAPITQVATSTLGGLSIYTNGVYGFTLLYPAYLGKTDFAATDTTAVEIGSAQEGITVSVQQSTKTVCEKSRAGETQQLDSTIQGVDWKAYSNLSKGIDANYRTLHDNDCYEIHEVATSSPDEILNTIVGSFTFVRS